MNFELQNFVERLPTREDLAGLARSLHFSRHPRDASTLELLGVFGAGMMVGSALAMMLTPRSGRELRASIRDRATRLVDDAHEAMDDARDAVRDTTESMVTEATIGDGARKRA